MKYRWQYFLLGLLIGIILSVITAILYKTTGSLQANNRDNGIENKPGVVSGLDEHMILTDQEETATAIPGKINLNDADITELMILPNIGEIKARKIVEYREKYGDFESVDELLYVQGIGKTVLDGLRNLIFID